MTNEHSYQTRGEPLWRVHKDGGAASCELRGTPLGWEFVVRIDNEITATRRYESERIARYYADALHQDYLRDGWTE